MKERPSVLYIGTHIGGECEFMGGGSALLFSTLGVEVKFIYLLGKEQRQADGVNVSLAPTLQQHYGHYPRYSRLCSSRPSL